MEHIRCPFACDETRPSIVVALCLPHRQCANGKLLRKPADREEYGERGERSTIVPVPKSLQIRQRE